MHVTLRHPGTGQSKRLECGWSWSLFLTSGLLGLPLFLRGLTLWGALMLAAWCIQFAAPLIDASGGLGWGPAVLIVALSAFFGFKGNALTINRYLALGYRIDGEA